MKFNGEHKDVTLRGIELAGSDRAVVAGGMNEMIGLVERNGMWEPYGLTKEFDRTLPTGCKRIMVHKTNMGENALCLFNNGNLKWMSMDDFKSESYNESDWQDTGLTGVEEVCMVGNMLTDQNLHSALFADNNYATMEVTNLHMEDLPNVQLRVRCDYDYQADVEKSEYGSGNSILTWQNIGTRTKEDEDNGDNDDNDGNDDNMMSLSYLKEQISGLITKAMGQWTKKGGLTGYVMAVVAYRLINGEYVLATMPQLLGAPYLIGDDGKYRRKILTGTFPLFNRYKGPRLAELPSVFHHEYESDINGTREGNKLQLDEDGYDNGEKINFINDTTKVVHDDLSTDVGDRFYAPYALGVVERYTQKNGVLSYTHEYSGVATCRSNILEYKISGDISQSFATSIDSVCVFLSKQVSGFSLVPEKMCSSDEIKSWMKRGGDMNQMEDRYVRCIYPVPRDLADVIEDLKECTTFYKVKEIPFSEITESSDWIKIDLEGKLGDNLFVQPSLQPSAFSNIETYGGKLFTYNNRIHIFDYKQTPSKLSDIRSYWYHEGFGQWTGFEPISSSSFGTYIWRVIARCKSTTYGEYVLDSGYYDSERPTNIGGLLCYPNPECYEMEIRILHSGTVYRHVFPMSEWKNAGIAININDSLRPYEWSEFDNISSSGTMNVNPTRVERAHPNMLKVSDTSFPFFPPAQTYTIGKSQIIGLSTFAIALSQDTFGKYPLLAFCDDGIFGISVGGKSGEEAITYGEISPYSREVCLSRRSICMLDGVVLFVSRRGLMLCTDKGVKLFAGSALGKIRHLPRNNSALGRGLEYYYNALHQPLLTMQEGTDSVTSVSFEEYIKLVDTETTYLSTKEAVMIYNPNYAYSYIVGIVNETVCKLPVRIQKDDDNYPETLFYADGAFRSAGIYSREDATQCIFQTRPMYMGGILRKSFRFLMRGTFIGDGTQRIGMYVLGSLNGENWKLMGAKEKVLSAEGFHDFGCETYRDEVAYFMVIVTGYLGKDSHIDKIEIDGMF